MSHLHNIDGYSSAAAAEYQEYLARLKTVSQAEREQEIEKKARAKRLDRSTHSEQDSSDDSDGSGSPDGGFGSPKDDPRGPGEFTRYIGRA
jgi:hypothetical protein